ncbi:MAG TPA: hypothetical protein VGO40_15025, partial [Longimicrobium sp.]|nr:hypothetical protein [Longimicrobium sp.]
MARRTPSPLAEPLVRWAGVPWAAGGGWLAGVIPPVVAGAVFRALFSAPALERLIAMEYRLAVIGAAAAVGFVVCGAVMAPSHRRAAALVLFGVGACAAWLLLAGWSPNLGDDAHISEPSIVPLVATLLGGVAALLLVWLRRLPFALPPRMERPAGPRRFGRRGGVKRRGALTVILL